jgi:hypothetical protein
MASSRDDNSGASNARSTIRTFVGAEWSPLEVSLVSIPQEISATVRSGDDRAYSPEISAALRNIRARALARQRMIARVTSRDETIRPRMNPLAIPPLNTGTSIFAPELQHRDVDALPRLIFYGERNA